MNRPRKALIYNACACMFAVSASLKCCVARCSVRCLGVVMGCMQRGISVVKVCVVCVWYGLYCAAALLGCWWRGE